MKGQTNYIHIFLAVSIAFIMVAIVTGLAFGVLWYFNNYVEENLDPSKNIITECIGKCQEEAACETGTVSSYKLINGACSCECAKVKVKTNTNGSAIADGWDTYTDNEYNFSFNYPANEFTTPETGNENYLRIQNYSSLEEKPGLLTGEYYLELHVLDVTDSSETCSEQIQDPISVTLGSQEGYRGSRLPGGDQGGRGFIMCIEKSDKQILIQVTGGEEEGTIANQILDTFQFINESTNSNWQSYTHTNFALQYPSGWEARADISGSDLALETITFSAPEIISDSLWSVLLYSSNSTSEDALIAKMGDQFSDRKEIRERITVGGKQATKVTVTTETITGWQHVQIFLEDSDTLYAINDGAGRNAEFETFYNSFQLINN